MKYSNELTFVRLLKLLPLGPITCICVSVTFEQPARATILSTTFVPIGTPKHAPGCLSPIIVGLKIF